MEPIKAFGIVVVLSILVISATLMVKTKPAAPTSELQIKKFSSYQDLSSYLQSKADSSVYFGGFGATAVTGAVPMAAGEKATETSDSTQDYSTTNVQVQGVDEADIVKNDGKYAYIISGTSIIIVDAWPAQNATIVSNITLDVNPQEIFINGDRLVVLGNGGYGGCFKGLCIERATTSIFPPIYWSNKAFVLVYDVSDRANPVLKNNITMDGSYDNSRMIGDWAYVVIDSTIGYENVTLPNITHNGITTTIQPEEIYYYDILDYSYRFSTVLGVNLKDDISEPSRKTLLTGWGEGMYVSQSKIYLTYGKQVSQLDYMSDIIDVFRPFAPADAISQIDTVLTSSEKKSDKWSKISEIMSNWTNSLGYEEWNSIQQQTTQAFYSIEAKMMQDSDKTIVYSISVSDGTIDFLASGEVPGKILNQFSMDEYSGYFRIATTTTEIPVTWTDFRQATTRNNVYVLDSALAITGRLENLAPGETIYSARFIDNRAYLVTFKRVDPLFVIDLSDPTSPQVLGKLKIPGFSEYLHPYDSTHIIGVGKDVPETSDGRAVPQGIKLALFDVSDVANPIEVSKYVIGTQSTYSEALNDHHAFLFSKSKDLLVIPINDWSWAENGNQHLNGAFVFKLTIDKGFELRGNISHGDSNNWDHYVHRAFYMDDVLYTLSDAMLKANSLTDLSDTKTVTIADYSVIY